MYRIIWCLTKNPLGETHSRDEARMENVILWIMANHESLTRLSAGYSVYLVDEENGLNETIWNWQEDKALCFGKLFVKGFPRMLHLVDGELRVYRDVLAVLNETPYPLEADEFSSMVVGDP